MPKRTAPNSASAAAPAKRTERLEIKLFPEEKQQIENEAKRLSRKPATHGRLVLLRRRTDANEAHDPVALARKLAQNILGLIEIGDYQRAADECERVLRASGEAI